MCTILIISFKRFVPPLLFAQNVGDINSLTSAMHSLLVRQQASCGKSSDVYDKQFSDHPAVGILRKSAQDRERMDEEAGNKDLLKSTNCEVLLPGQARERRRRRVGCTIHPQFAFILRHVER